MYGRRVKSVFDKLTPTEQKIGVYIKEHPREAQHMTSYDLANTLDVGQSTIIRFSKKLGYTSFRELQVSLASTLESATIEDISVNESTNSTNYKIMKQYQDIVNLTYAQNSDEHIEEAIRHIKQSNRIAIYGVGNSNLFAEYFSNQLSKIGFFPYFSTKSHLINSALTQMDSGDLLILISESGETPQILKAARLANTRAVPVLAITRAVKNKLYDYADLVLKTVNYMGKTRLETMTIRCSQLCVIDMVYLNLFKTDYDKYRLVVQQAEDLLENKC